MHTAAGAQTNARREAEAWFARRSGGLGGVIVGEEGAQAVFQRPRPGARPARTVPTATQAGRGRCVETERKPVEL